MAKSDKIFTDITDFNYPFLSSPFSELQLKELKSAAEEMINKSEEYIQYLDHLNRTAKTEDENNRKYLEIWCLSEPYSI